MDNLKKMLGKLPGPEPRDILKLYLRSEFEPHGRASETFEFVWRLELGTIPFHWLSTTGWQKGNTDKPMSFEGRSATEVIAKAKAFCKELEK